MRTLLLSALVLLVASPGFAADPGKPAETKPQAAPNPTVAAPPIQSDAVKPLENPTVVPPPPKPAGTQVAPKIQPPSPTGTPSVSTPKVSPGGPAVSAPKPTPGAPAAGIPGIDPKLGTTIRDANQMDAIRDLKQLEQLHRDPMQRGAPAGVGGDQGPPRTLGTGRLGTPPGQPGQQGLGRDCLANPQNCIDGDPGNAAGPRDRFGAPPAVRGAVRDGSGRAGESSGDGTTPFEQDLFRRLGAPKSSLETTLPNGDSTSSSHENGEVNTTSTTSDDPTEGPSTEHVRTIRHDDGSEAVHSTTAHHDGAETFYRHEMDSEGNGWYQYEVRHADGTRESWKGTLRGGVNVGGGGGPSSQPREDPSAGTGTRDNCRWTPLHGCLNRSDFRRAAREMTRQPSRGDQENASTGGGSRGSSTGPEAVTNTGDGSFGVQRSGNQQQGTPIWQTMPDPARGGPGGPAPGSPVRRAGSDAGIDAGTGALPVPPPPR